MLNERYSMNKSASFFTLVRRPAALFAAILLSTQMLQAEGFRIYGLSTDAQMRGEAVVASGSDASAIWYNPAALPKSGGTSVSINSNNMWIQASHTDALNREEKNNRSFFPLLGAYVSVSPKDSGLAFGLGVNTPFGLATEYSKNSAFRYITTGGQITLVNINPTVSYRFHRVFSAGAGLDYYYSTTELRQQYPWAAVGFANGLGAGALTLPDGSVTIQGRGDGVGFNVGFLIEPSPKHAIGLTYRSQVLVRYSGEPAEITNIPLAFQAAFPSVNQSIYTTRAKTSIRYPDIINTGYAFKPSNRTTVEIGGQITRWETVRSLDIKLDQPTLLFPNSSNKLDWRNTFVARVGGEHWLGERWALGAGYFYDSTPTNELTYTQLVPDGNHHVMSAGVKYKHKDWVFSLPVVGGIQTGTDSITKSLNTDATRTQTSNGKYTLNLIQIGLSASYRWN